MATQERTRRPCERSGIRFAMMLITVGKVVGVVVVWLDRSSPQFLAGKGLPPARDGVWLPLSRIDLGASGCSAL